MSSANDHLSDSELQAMTRQLDEMHRDQGLPALKAAVAEWVSSFREAGDGVGRRASSRRTFLLGAAGVSERSHPFGHRRLEGRQPLVPVHLVQLVGHGPQLAVGQVTVGAAHQETAPSLAGLASLVG